MLWGMQLARLGYRPIPLYNGLPFPVNEKMSATRSSTTVAVEPISAAVCREAQALVQLHLPPDAPPAFLLDADRGNALIRPAPGIFDNRSVCFATDFPSPGFMVSHGIRRAIVVQRDSPMARDLNPILVAWQEGGVEILGKHTSDQAAPAAVGIKRLGLLSRLWYHLVVAFRLQQANWVVWRHDLLRQRMIRNLLPSWS